MLTIETDMNFVGMCDILIFMCVKASGSPIYYLTLYFLMIIAENSACDAATLIQRK